MRKQTTWIQSCGRSAVALSLAVSLAAFGCTTNRTAGNGEPVMTLPAAGPTPPSATPGSSSGMSGNPPMASAFSRSLHTE